MTTIKMDADEIAALRVRLEGEGFELRPLAHAHFQARGPGLVVSAYKSGKVVVQGKRAAEFASAEGLDGPALKEAVAGSDESGKGDYFGPLVVAAVLVRPGQEKELARMGVRDCKRMSDNSVLRAAAAIRKRFPHAIRALAPPEYNAHHAAEGNLALFLSRMHAEAIAAAVKGCGIQPRVVIDQFTFAHRLKADLAAAGLDLEVEIRPKAEDNPAVAAASVLARAEFLIGLKDLENDFGTMLPKGAGAPVDRVARALFAAGGRAALEAVAKIHFKTTEKVTRRLF